MRILLVEDEERLSQALVEIFKKNRIGIDAVLNGADGLEYALGGAYDAIILDIMLPGMDGISVGLSDPTAVRGIFRPGAFPDLEYAGAICLVDAMRFHKVYQTARVCRMQLAISDLVLINKTDLATREQIDGIAAVALAQKPARPVHETTFGEFDADWLEELEQPQTDSGPIEGHIKDIDLQKLILTVSGFDRKSLESFLRMFAEDTYRIKGFVVLDGAVCIVDCVGPMVEVRPFAGVPSELDRLVVLFGHGLPARKGIREAVPRFPHCEVTVS